MAKATGETPSMPNNEPVTSPTTFPNTRQMKLTTDFSQNPGVFDDVFKKIKDLMPLAFEGAKLSVSKPLSAHFQVSHSMTLSSGANSGYKFGASYAGTQMYSAGEIYPLLLGDMDANGNANAQMIHQWNDRLRARFVTQVQEFKLAGHQLCLDYRTPYTSTSMTFVNADLFSKSSVVILQHLARVTNSIDLGTELVYQASPMIPGRHIAINSYVARYRAADWYTGVKVSPAGVINLAYFHQKVNSPLQFGVEFESSLAVKETSATLSYQYEMSKANTTFRGMIDTNGLVTGVIEKRLFPLPFTLLISSSLNHAKSAYRFGLGLMVN